MARGKVGTQVVTETFLHPQTRATNSLRYFMENGKHVVVHIMTAGEDVAPDYHRCDDIDAARSAWSRLKQLLFDRGYIPKTNCGKHKVVEI
jgi:hypothetical protein